MRKVGRGGHADRMVSARQKLGIIVSGVLLLVVGIACTIYAFNNTSKIIPSASRIPNSMYMSVMTFNLHLLRSRSKWGDEGVADVFNEPLKINEIVGEIKSFCNKRGPDYLLLQEIPTSDGKVKEDFEAFMKAISRYYKDRHCVKASTYHSVCIFGKVKGSLKDKGGQNINDKRALASARVELGGQSFTLISTHISPQDQAALVKALQTNYSGAIIIGGDFNADLRDGTDDLSQTFAPVLNTDSTYPPTLSSDGTTTNGKTVDFLLLSPDASTKLVLNSPLQFGEKLISDHLPVTAVFRLAA